MSECDNYFGKNRIADAEYGCILDSSIQCVTLLIVTTSLGNSNWLILDRGEEDNILITILNVQYSLTLLSLGVIESFLSKYATYTYLFLIDKSVKHAWTELCQAQLDLD